IFSVVHAVLLRPFPFGDPERVVHVHETWRGMNRGGVSAPNFMDWREQATVFEHLAAVHHSNFNLADAAVPERVMGARVTHGYFEVFGVRPLLGRVFLEDDDPAGGERAVILSHRLWQRRFGADSAVVGRQIMMDGASHTVVGVMP